MPSDAEASINRIRELNEQVIDMAKQSGSMALDAYEKNLAAWLDLQKRVASASPLDFVSDMANTQAEMVQSISSAFVSMARQAMK